MPQGRALLIGLKEIDEEAYGWDGRAGCAGCELDVDNMRGILEPLGYRMEILKTQAAFAENVLAALNDAADSLEEGDIFVFFYSGHGGQQPDANSDEMDGKDETLVLYDRELIDDELNEVWMKFKAGVRIVMLSDSCNSGTNYRAMRDIESSTMMVPIDADSVEIQAQMIHIGGCRDGGYSFGFDTGGEFSVAIRDTWAEGDFEGTYQEFYEGVKSRITTSQEPQLNEYGPVEEVFRSRRPFTV